MNQNPFFDDSRKIACNCRGRLRVGRGTAGEQRRGQGQHWYERYEPGRQARSANGSMFDPRFELGQRLHAANAWTKRHRIEILRRNVGAARPGRSGQSIRAAKICAFGWVLRSQCRYPAWNSSRPEARQAKLASFGV